MSKKEYRSKNFRITHTVEEDGPHPTIPYAFYEDTFAITVIIEGNGTCYIEENNYTLSSGDIIVMSPDEIHFFNFAQTGRHERISIYFSALLLSSLNEYELELLQIFRTHTPQSSNKYAATEYRKEVVMPILNQICSILYNEKIPMLEARLHTLIIQLLFLLYDSKKCILSSKEIPSRDNLTGEICKYIKDNLTENLSYESLQKRFFVSKYQLTRVFRHYTGMTLTEYIINKRLMHAISLVRGGQGIETAAYNSGFRTYSHFYKEFIKHYNISPKKYFDIKKI